MSDMDTSLVASRSYNLDRLHESVRPASTRLYLFDRDTSINLLAKEEQLKLLIFPCLIFLDQEVSES